MIEVRYQQDDDWFQFVLREGTGDDTIFEWRDDWIDDLSMWPYSGGQIMEWDEYQIPDKEIRAKILHLLFEKEIK